MSHRILYHHTKHLFDITTRCSEVTCSESYGTSCLKMPHDRNREGDKEEREAREIKRDRRRLSTFKCLDERVSCACIYIPKMYPDAHTNTHTHDIWTFPTRIEIDKDDRGSALMVML